MKELHKRITNTVREIELAENKEDCSFWFKHLLKLVRKEQEYKKRNNMIIEATK